MRIGLTLVLLLLGAAGRSSAQGRLVDDSVRSAALEGNRLGDPSVRPLRIYLPPSYDNGEDRRYPVLYLLHGFRDTPVSWSDGSYSGLRLERAMDSLIGAGQHEFIIAMVDGSNTYGGSVFTNSIVTGNWETYLVRDVIRQVDGHYRTLRRPSSRGIGGYSMGAGAALRIAMRYPNGFGLVYAVSPNAELPCQWMSPAEQRQLLAVASDRAAHQLTGDPQLCLGYGAAWSPDSTRPPTYVALPFQEREGRIVVDSLVLEQWSSWKLLDMIPRYREGLVRLRGIGIDVGESDRYAPGVARLDSLLTRLRIRHQYQHYPGDHGSGIPDRVVAHLLPFFSAGFDFGPTEQ